MAISFLPVSDHRFKKSPFFSCYDHKNTRYGIYNNRLYPISSDYDATSHYQHLRTKSCLYDVPETPLKIVGKDSLPFLENLFTREIRKIKIGRAGYAIACNQEGGVVMDGVLLRPNDEEFIYVHADGDFLNWAKAHIGNYEVSIHDFDSWVLQIQGPTALEVLEEVSDIQIESFTYYSTVETRICGTDFYVSRSGWTGERGFEIYSKNSDFDGPALWEYLLEKGKSAELLASDVSSMHIRRLEAGILDYGTDIDQSLNPFEIGLGRLVHLDKGDFIGRQALSLVRKGMTRVTGMICDQASPVRGDKLISKNGEEVGFVSAGAWSPTLDAGIGLIRLKSALEAETELLLDTENGSHHAKVTNLPFYDKKKLLTK